MALGGGVDSPPDTAHFLRKQDGRDQGEWGNSAGGNFIKIVMYPGPCSSCRFNGKGYRIGRMRGDFGNFSELIRQFLRTLLCQRLTNIAEAFRLFAGKVVWLRYEAYF